MSESIRTPTEFIKHLKEQTIPDLKASGRICDSIDFEYVVEIVEGKDKEIKRLNDEIDSFESRTI